MLQRNIKNCRRLLSFAGAGILICQLSMASVSIKNGNFFMGYTDIVFPGGFEPKIDRTYNSKTPFKGIFGNGWGNEYESYLTVSADGSVVVHEYGGGAENRFIPVGFKDSDLDDAVSKIVEEAKKDGILSNPKLLADYQTRLRNDATFRNDEWERYKTRGRMTPRKLPDGTQLQSNQFSYQYITKVNNGYIRVMDSGKMESFNDGGKLVKVADKNGNFIALSYGSEGRLAKIEDNFNRKMFLTFNKDGLVARVEGEGQDKKVANYTYNNSDELVMSVDSDKNTYTYRYDSDHNMTEIGYSDKTKMQISYYGRDKYQNVKSIRGRDGILTEYDYTFENGNRNNVTVAIQVKDKAGKTISKNKYQYISKIKAGGDVWTYKLITDLDGDRTETTYNDQNMPILIKHGMDETNFSYDKRGHVTKKVTPYDTTELEYDQAVNKVSRVVQFTKESPNEKTWSEFQYDQKGNLTTAKNSAGKGVRLIYDSTGRIKTLVDQSRNEISFKYNEHSKPIQITDSKLGSINVVYSNSGDIKSVESPAGRQIAAQVTDAFQSLLEIIRPAGVSLSF